MILKLDEPRLLGDAIGVVSEGVSEVRIKLLVHLSYWRDSKRIMITRLTMLNSLKQDWLIFFLEIGTGTPTNGDGQGLSRMGKRPGNLFQETGIKHSVFMMDLFL